MEDICCIDTGMEEAGLCGGGGGVNLVEEKRLRAQNGERRWSYFGRESEAPWVQNARERVLKLESYE